MFQFISLVTLVRSCRSDDNGAWYIGTETQSMDDESRRRLVTFCHVVHPYRQLRDETPARPRVARSGERAVDAPVPSYADATAAAPAFPSRATVRAR